MANSSIAGAQPGWPWQVPTEAPRWIRRGRFYDFPRMASGEVVPLRRMRFGNVLLRGDLVRAEPGPFDASYGLAAGEDGDMLIRLVNRGGRIVWCDHAIVYEPIEAKRLSLRWLMRRALGGGQEFARKSLSGRYGPISGPGRVLFFARVAAQMLIAAALALLSLPLGHHRAACWIITASANFGKLSVFWGSRYREYAVGHA